MARSPRQDRVAQLVQYIGEDAALKLVEAFGGLGIKLSDHPRKGVLVNAIGIEAAQALGKALGRGLYRVPVARSWRAGIYRRQGKSHPWIARKLAMTESGVWRMLREKPPPEPVVRARARRKVPA